MRPMDGSILDALPPFLTPSPKCLESKVPRESIIAMARIWGCCDRKNRDRISDVDERRLEFTNCGIQPELEK